MLCRFCLQRDLLTMQEVMTAAYKTSARVYRQDLSIAPLASQGLPFLGVPLACRERGDRDMARLAAGLMPPMTGCWSRRYCSVGGGGRGIRTPGPFGQLFSSHLQSVQAHSLAFAIPEESALL